MLSELSHWKETWSEAGGHRPTVLEVHFGHLLSRKQERLNLNDEITKHLGNILDCIKPEILRVHLDQNFCQPSKQVLSMLNGRRYLMNSLDNTWTIWLR